MKNLYQNFDKTIQAGKVAVMLLYVAVMFFCFYRTANAAVIEPASKQISFTLESNYDACTFTITTEYSGNFEVVMNYGSTEYTATIENSNFCDISAEDVSAGKYTITVTEILDEEQYAETNGDNESENEAEEGVTERSADYIIGSIKVSAKAIDKTAFSVGNVSVARDIVGLQYYFKDDAIVVEWTDLSCGNVKITIIDTKTSQILNTQTISGTYFEYELADSVEEITIDVVPATSSNITGANVQYTVTVENNPDAVVTYEDKEYVNTETIPVTVTLNDGYSLMFVSNGQTTQETETLDAGTYTCEVPVSEGSNTILTYVIDADHNMRSTSYSVIRDSVKPALTLDMEYDGAKTYDSIAYIQGTIKDYDTFTINEVEPTVSGDGSFIAEYILNDGENVLNIRATDLAGNETLYTATITKLVKEESSIPWIPIICVVVCIGAAVFMFIQKKRGDNGGDPGDNDKDTEKKAAIKFAFPKRNKQSDRPEKQDKPKVEKNDEKAEIIGAIKKTIIEAVVVFVVFYSLFTYVIPWAWVPSGSMEPTIDTGSVIFTNALAYKINEPQRGDIIFFESDELGEYLIKRIIGIPGDTIEFADGYVYINGELVYEEYLDADVETNCWKSFEVPDGCYFVMGDNREDSYDARYWSNPYISKDAIKGKLMVSIPVKKIIRTVKNLF